MPFAVVQHVPIVRAQSRVEHQPLWLSGRDEFDPFDLRLTRGARVNRIAVTDLDRHPAVAQALDGHRRPPSAARCPCALDVLQSVVDQRRGVEPLGEEPLQVHPRDLLGDVPKGGLVHVLEFPAGVVRPQDAAHRLIAHHVAQLLVEQLRLGVDHRVVGGEVAVALAHHRDGLAPALQVPEQDVPLDPRIRRALTVRLEKPAGLEARESFIQPAFAPFVVGENPHRVVVSHLVHDEAEPRAAVHHHHGKLGAAPFDAVHVRDLRPGELAVERVEPGERHLGALHRHAFSPRRAVTGLVQHAHDHVAVTTLFIAIVGIQREREVVHIFGVEPDALTPGSRLGAPRTAHPVPRTLVVDRSTTDRRPFPARIAFHRYARRSDHLVLDEVEDHVVARELAVELARRIERMVLPAVLVVHDDLRIPLREIEAPALPSLAPRQRRGPSLPRDLHHHRVAGRECARERPVGNRRVGCVRVIGHPERRLRDPLERVIGVLETLKALSPLSRVHRGPAGGGAKRVQVLVHVEVVQRGG